LERWAADEFRSVNAHIEFLLRDAAVRAGRLGGRANRNVPPGGAEPPDRQETEKNASGS